MYGGIVIDGLVLNKDLFYYKIPCSLVNTVQIGSRVVVPFSGKNELYSGFVFDIRKTLPDDTQKVKEISDIIEEPLFGKNIRDLFIFTATQYLLPLHFLVNQYIKTIGGKRLEKYIQCTTDFQKLDKSLQKEKGLKKEFIDYLADNKLCSLSSIKKNFGRTALQYIKDLEQIDIIRRISIETGKTTKYLTLAHSEKKTKKMLESIEKKRFHSAVSITERLKKVKTHILDEKTLIKGIKYGRATLEILRKENILKETPFIIKGTTNMQAQVPQFTNGSSLKTRNKQIIRQIQTEITSKGKVLVIFPELTLIQRVEEEYKEAFGDDLFVWKGTNKRNFIKDVNMTGKRVILATPFSLFIEISQLELIVVANASSKYFKQSDFLPFNALIVALKRASLEKTKLIFSSVLPEDNIFFLIKKGLIRQKEKETLKTNIQIVDMRKEFKCKNRKMLSRSLEKQMRDILNNDGNVALLLNRKAYSTFMMCRECGYVIKCPDCETSLYYDKERNKLVCPVCGYTTNLLDVCPRCKSPNIHYFGGGVQKLIEQVSNLFPNIDVIKMISGTKASERKLLDSKNYSHTVFVGTEFLLSHLLLDNVDLFGFISIDIFLHHFAFDAAMNAMRVVSEVAGEMDGKEIIVQTYLPEHYAVSAIQNMDYKQFFEEEFLIRKELSYPPFKNLIIFTFKGKKNYETLGNGLKFKKILQKKFSKEIEVLGPSPAAISKKGEHYFYEMSIKTNLTINKIRPVYFEFLSKKTVKIRPEVHLCPLIIE